LASNICIAQPGQDTSFDCLYLRAFAKLDKLGTADYGSEVSIQDGFQTNGPSVQVDDLNADSSIENETQTSSNSWVEVPERTYKTCGAGSVEGTITCESLNFSVYRDFETTD